MRAWIIILLAALLIPGAASAQEIAGIEAEGTCGEFLVTVTAANLTEGCWDVKLDVPGRAEHQGGEWKSTFYYLKGAICTPETRAEVRLDLNTAEGEVQGTAKLRQSSKIITKPFTLYQDCPDYSIPSEWMLLTASASVLVILWAVGWWWKQKPKPKTKRSKKRK